MFDQLIIALMILTGLVVSVMAVVQIVGSAMYDVRAAKRRRHYQQHPHARCYRQRPLVTLLVSAQDGEGSIKACLNNLLASSYKKLEIIVVDHGSHDTTKQLVRQYIAQRPSRTIRLIARRSSDDRHAALICAYARHGHGEIIMTLNAGDILEHDSLARAVQYFAAMPAVAVVQPARVATPNFSIASLFEVYHTMLGCRARKTASIFHADYAMHDISLYRRDRFLAHKRNSRIAARSITGSRPAGEKRHYYANDVIVHASVPTPLFALFRQSYEIQSRRLQALIERQFFSAAASANAFLVWSQLAFVWCVGLAGLLAPLLLGYFAYLAFRLREPALLLITAGLLGGFLLFAIWDNEQLKIRQKFLYIFGTPITGVFYCALSFVPLVAVLRFVVAKAIEPVTSD